MTKPRLLNNICETESAGAYVYAISSDLGGTNQGLHTQLGITPEKPYFENPVDKTRNCHVFMDEPHLVKNGRSNLMDNACIMPNGYHASKEDFEDLLPHIADAEISTGYILIH